MLWVPTPKTQDLGNESSALWNVSEMTLPQSSLERSCAPKHIKAAHTAPFYSHWWTQWGQTPPRDFPHPAELSFCPAVLPRVWYCKLQPRVSTGGPSSTDNQHLSHAEPRVITRKGAQGIPQAADLLQQYWTFIQIFLLRDTEVQTLRANLTEPGKGAGSSNSHSTARELPLSSSRALQASTPLGPSLTTWLLKHLRVLSLLYEKENVFI